MSLGLIKPGQLAAGRIDAFGTRVIVPLAFIGGKAVWPVAGGAPDDDSDAGGDEDDEDFTDEDSDDDEDKDPPKGKSKTKKKRTDDADDDDDDEDEEEKLTRPERQAARYRTRLRERERELEAAQREIRALKGKDKKPEERASEELTETRERLARAEREVQSYRVERAFTNTSSALEIAWVDPEDALAVAQRLGLLEDAIDEDGTVDKRELRRALKELARRKKHLVKVTEKSSRDDSDEDDEDDEEEEPRPRRSARTGNSRRKGQKADADRAALAKRFPVLR